MKLIFIGDVFGEAGRHAIEKCLPEVRTQYDPDIVIANAENVSGGRGMHPKQCQELLRSFGIDVLTSGNHVYDIKEVLPLLSNPEMPILRPLNYPRKAPGRGYRLMHDRRGVPILIINAMGRIFMEPLDCPFQAVEDVLSQFKHDTAIVVVDFHAEATSEKRAFGWYFNGKVSAVLGTHTHVPTADDEILDGGTAYISDVGMTGPYGSVIGMNKDTILKRFTCKFAERAEAATEDARFSAVYVEIDDYSGKAVKIERIQKRA